MAGGYCGDSRRWDFWSLLFGIPRSPRWSASKNRIDEALAVLKLMGEQDPEAELADIRAALAEEHATAHEPVFRWKYRYPLFLAITIGAFNQLAGINAILYYLNSIFAAAGFSQISGDQQAIAIGLTNLVFTMVGMIVDRQGWPQDAASDWRGGHGRVPWRGAWVFSTATRIQARWCGCWSSTSPSSRLSQGAVIWVYIGEVFPNHVRSKGQGVGNASHWIMNTIIALTFRLVRDHRARRAVYVSSPSMTVVQFLVVLFTYPETKGQTLEQLQRKLVSAK